MKKQYGYILFNFFMLFMATSLAQADSFTYTISLGADGFSSAASQDTITISSSSSTYSWTAKSNSSWITISSGTSGTGDGAVTFTVDANTTGSHRRGTLTIAGATITIRQAKSPFSDDPADVYSKYIYAIYTEGITVGCGADLYCPLNNVTRGQMAAFIIRAKYGETFSYTATPYFSDVPANNTFFKYVQKMKDDGITTTSGTYMVDDFVTREQMAAFIIRAKYGETFDYSTTPYYTDVPSTSVFFKYVQKMKDDGITTTTGNYMASDNVTREQMAAFLGRAFLGMLQTTTVAIQYVPKISTGDSYSVALKNDGIVWDWGDNYGGQLGDGTTINQSTPVQVRSLTGIISIATGYYHTLALKDDGTLWAWGVNGNGQLGDGTEGNLKMTPVPVSDLTGVTTVAAGCVHTVALKNDGTVWAWGWNGLGQLGDGTENNQRATPVQVSGITGVTAVAGGQAHSVALKNDGTVWAWGDNEYGQLGDGTTTNRLTPVQVSGLTDVTAVSVGGGCHSIALKNDGTVWAWGQNAFGGLGDGTENNQRTTPVQVNGLTGVIALAAGISYSVALKNDGTVWAWGWNGKGQLGDGTTTKRTTPVQVSDLTGVTAVAAGGSHCVALKNDGTLWAWGYNHHGQLGDGTTTDRTTPVQVSGLNLF